jgi:surface protein
VVKDTDVPILSTAIDHIDGNRNPGEDSEKAIRENSPVLNHPTLRRRDVASVTFLPSLEGAPSDAWDVSEAGDGQVLAWATPNGELYDLTIAGNGGVKIVDPQDLPSKLFQDFTNATVIDFNGCVDLSERGSMREAFWGCEALETVNFSGVCFENVWDMGYMFSGCHSLKTLDTSGWKTPNSTDLEGMFMNCLSLEELDLSGLDTSSVTRMVGLFANCDRLVRLDLSGFDTHRVTTMEGLFEGCTRLEELDVSSFDTYERGVVTLDAAKQLMMGAAVYIIGMALQRGKVDRSHRLQSSEKVARKRK